MTESVINVTATAADIAACTDPLTGNDLCPILQEFSAAMSKAHFDEARELIESYRGIRIPLSANAEDSLCHSLISACIQLVKAENAYYSLNFMIPKAFFRRESSLLSNYSQIKAELCSLDDITGNAQNVTRAEDIRRRLIDLISARISMINVYNSFLVENFCLPSELTTLAAVLSSVEDLLAPLVNHESLGTLFNVVMNEVIVMKLLLETQLALLRCEFLLSLIKLKNAHAKLHTWFNTVGFNRSNTKTTTRFFNFGSQVQSFALRLCDWTDEFYNLLLAKFSLYFHDVMQTQCSVADFDHTISTMKQPNFVQTFTAFYRKMEPLFILLIVNRCDSPDIPPVIGYGSAAEPIDGEGELRRNFLVLLKIGGEIEVHALLPSISILIQEAAARNPATERITYCYDQLISKSFFVLLVEYNLYAVIVFGRRIGERDSMVVNFLLNSCSQLRCAKICQSLRKVSK